LKKWNVNYLCPTFKHTITDELYKKHVQSNRMLRFRSFPIRKSELSLFLNFREVFETICKTYKDGTFLVLEADAFALENIRELNECLIKIHGKEWSGINLSLNQSTVDFLPEHSYVETLGYRSSLSDEEKRVFEKNCIEDLSDPSDKDVRFMRKYHTRCTDSQLWSYKGCYQMLEQLTNNTNYDIPLDYFFTELFEKNLSIKYYWTDKVYFDQSSNRKIDNSTIQNDNS
jgi:hypothetical protein